MERKRKREAEAMVLDVNNTANILCESVKIYARMRIRMRTQHSSGIQFHWLNENTHTRAQHTHESHIWTKNITPFSMIYGIFINICRASLSSPKKKCNELEMQLVDATDAALTMHISHEWESSMEKSITWSSFFHFKRCNFQIIHLYNHFFVNSIL